MADNGEKYTVTAREVYACQVGENYVFDKHDGEGSELAHGVTRDEAYAIAEKHAESWEDGTFKIIKAHVGLDTVEYENVEISQWDEDGLSAEVIDVLSSLPDSVRKGMERQKKDYWAFLDYDGDSYGHVEDYMTCSITQAADMLGVSRQRVHQMLSTGTLAGEKVGNTWVVSTLSVERRKKRQ